MALLTLLRAVIGGGFCENCTRRVNTVNGRYRCHSCGHVSKG